VQAFTGGILGPAGSFLAGGAILSQSQTGRYVLAGQIIAGAVVTAVACGGTCTPVIAAAAKGAAIGAVSGATLGGYSAAKNDGDLSSGILFGAAIGGVTGAAAGAIGALAPTPITFSPAWLLPKAGAGFVGNFGSGAISNYAGGRGQVGDILRGATYNALAGTVTTPLGDALSGALGSHISFGDASLTPDPMIDLQGNVVDGPIPWAGFREMAEALQTTPGGIFVESLKGTSAEIYGDKMIGLLNGRRINIP
jgi:hypothetical protein